MEETWTTRDLVVLTAAVALTEKLAPREIPDGEEIVNETGLAERDVILALSALNDEYLKVDRRGAGLDDASRLAITKIYPAARFAVGQWPTGEVMLDKLVAGLERAADAEDDPERKSKLKDTASWLGAGLRDTAANVLGAVIAHGMGMG